MLYSPIFQSGIGGCGPHIEVSFQKGLYSIPKKTDHVWEQFTNYFWALYLDLSRVEAILLLANTYSVFCCFENRRHILKHFTKIMIVDQWMKNRFLRQKSKHSTLKPHGSQATIVIAIIYIITSSMLTACWWWRAICLKRRVSQMHMSHDSNLCPCEDYLCKQQDHWLTN